MKSAGYSGTPLAKKLGIKDGFKIRIVNHPKNYFDLFIDFPKNVEVLSDKNIKKNFIHYFTKSAKELSVDVAGLREEIVAEGMIWISWPKKASKVATDINEDVIRNIALANSLVDIKVCAVDEVWSALKLVIPVEKRK